MDWQDIQGNLVLLPPRPRAIIHFLGGAFLAAAPNVTYRLLLEALANQGYVIIATPFVNTFDHRAIAAEVLRRFERCLVVLLDNQLRGRYLPLYGLGHSMGCKVHLLIGSDYEVERAGNILLAFNNFEAKRSIPFLDRVIETVQPLVGPTVNLDVEFTPSPGELLALVRDRYCVRRNLLVKFRTDELDQTRSLAPVLETKFAGMVSVQRLPGNHLTPLGQDVQWQAGQEFSALDAIGQWMRQEFFRDLNRLQEEILTWLAPADKTYAAR